MEALSNVQPVMLSGVSKLTLSLCQLCFREGFGDGCVPFQLCFLLLRVQLVLSLESVWCWKRFG